VKKGNYVAFLPFYLMIVILFIGFAHSGSNAVTVLHESRPLKWTHCIVIDAGHGGIDGGATSCTGALESGINLEIALRLEALLQLLGMNTKMIRTKDVSIYTSGNSIAAQKVSDLKERVRIANETDGAILISIHQNTFSDSRYDGAQVFYPPAGEGQYLAEALQKSLIATLNSGSRRSPKRAAGVYLMEHIQCPGILIECGFLSNPQEEAKLRSPEYQKKLCCVIAANVVSFALDRQTND
jgi:N-acetylmuramoyl-L-alanine amidase